MWGRPWRLHPLHPGVTMNRGVVWGADRDLPVCGGGHSMSDCCRTFRVLFLWTAAALFSGLLNGCGGRAFYNNSDGRAYFRPGQFGLAYDDVSFASRDGTRLHGWFLPAVGKPIGTIVHYHGDSASIGWHLVFVRWLPAEGFNVFLFDYRGFGASEGTPTNRGVHDDGVAALEYVLSRRDVNPARLILLGQSMGGAVAIDAAATAAAPGIRAIILDSAFYSYRRVVRDLVDPRPLGSVMKWPLAYFLFSDEFSPENRIDLLPPVPMLIIHGTRDRVVRHDQAYDLFARARGPRAFCTVVGLRHNAALLLKENVCRRLVADYCRRALAGGPAPNAAGRTEWAASSLSAP